MLQITYNNSRVSDLRLCRESPTLRIRAVRGPYGDAIRRLRDDRDWTQEQLADRAGVQRDTIVRAEKSGNVGVLLLYQIAQALDVDMRARSITWGTDGSTTRATAGQG
jgi:DNA-binding XRE family transcriptional regulator